MTIYNRRFLALALGPIPNANSGFLMETLLEQDAAV